MKKSSNFLKYEEQREKGTYAALQQDFFACVMNSRKKGGVYVDIGCRDPYIGNNTWFLEENYGWRGISLDIVDYSNAWRERESVFIQSDALKDDMLQIFKKNNLPKVIDYLTHDIEGNGDRYQSLIRLPFDDYEFKVITIEHDAYRGYIETERNPQRIFLKSRGYKLISSNVKSWAGDVMEDWWINPKYVDSEVYSSFISKGKKYKKIFKEAEYDMNILFDSGE